VQGPYREGKPLADLIPPDRRREKAVGLVVVSMVIGAVLFHFGRSLFEPSAPQEPEKGQGLSAPLTREEVERVVAAHHVALKQACWEDPADGRQTAQVTLLIDVEPSGAVADLEVESASDPRLSRCIESQVRAWTFPRRDQPTMRISLPFTFGRL
jgi:hypothetical protein